MLWMLAMGGFDVKSQRRFSYIYLFCGLKNERLKSSKMTWEKYFRQRELHMQRSYGKREQRTKRRLAMLCDTREMDIVPVIRNPSVEPSLVLSYMFET